MLFKMFVKESIKLYFYKTQLTCSSKLTCSLYTCTQAVETFEKNAHAEYCVELKSMTRYNHFRIWKTEDVDHLQTKVSNVIEKMNICVPQLMSLFCAITQLENLRSKCDKNADDSC